MPSCASAGIGGVGLVGLGGKEVCGVGVGCFGLGGSERAIFRHCALESMTQPNSVAEGAGAEKAAREGTSAVEAAAEAEEAAAAEAEAGEAGEAADAVTAGAVVGVRVGASTKISACASLTWIISAARSAGAGATLARPTRL